MKKKKKNKKRNKKKCAQTKHQGPTTYAVPQKISQRRSAMESFS